MLITVPVLPHDEARNAAAPSFIAWLRAHQGAIAVAGLLSFAAPLTFFTGALSVMRAPTLATVLGLALWWMLYGLSLWGLLLLAGYAVERVPPPWGRFRRAAVTLLAAGTVAALANALTAGRATLLIAEGLVYSEATMHLHGFVYALIMALLYFAHLRRSREHARAAARLAAAQTAQRETRLRIVQARLQEVRARIDPQLLFEMLDALRRLYGHDAQRAERFLDQLIVFLRAALPRLRSASSSLLREVELAGAFAQLRELAGATAARLDVDIAAEVRHARFPPGVLLPLLDTGSRSGGPCRLVADRGASGCRIRLVLDATPAPPTLAHVRTLLVALHGSAARMHQESSPGVTTITVEVPFELA